MYTGYFSCNKCCVEGEIVDNIMCFPETNFEMRTDYSFRNRVQKEHHVGTTGLEKIPKFDLIKCVPLDYMHLICLGVVKRLIVHSRYGWVYGKPPHKLSFNKISQISNLLILFKKFIPVELVRKTRIQIILTIHRDSSFKRIGA